MFGEDIPISEICCIKLKEEPLGSLKYKNIMSGEQALESVQREQAWLKKGCNYKMPDGSYKSKPLSAVSPQTILRAIYEREIPICKDYGQIIREQTCDGVCYKCEKAKRTGCALCGFGIKFDTGRFVRLQKKEEAKIKWAFTPKSQGGAGYLEACEFANEFCNTKIEIPKI